MVGSRSTRAAQAASCSIGCKEVEWLVVILTSITCAGVLLTLWVLFEMQRILQRMERLFSQWTVQEDPTPMPKPGTMFVPDDAEVARRERALKADSQQRADALGATSRRTGRR